MKKQNREYRIGTSTFDNGFTLIEILVFTAIVSIFFVVSAAVSAFSLSVMRTNENRVYAAHYAEESIEWLRNQKETLDWTTFTAYTGLGTARCINTLGWTASAACLESDYSLGAVEYGKRFNRNLTLTDAGGIISASVTVTWKDIGGRILTVPVSTVFTQSE